MRCRAAQRRLSAYADGALALYEMVALKEHLSGCARCRRELAEVRHLNRMLAERPVADAEINWPAFEARLARKLERQRVGLLSMPWYRHAAFVRGLVAAAATVLFLVLGILALNRWLSPAMVNPLPAPQQAVRPHDADGSTLRQEGPGSLQVVTNVAPRPEPAVETPKAPAPEPAPNRLAWLAAGDSAWQDHNTTLVVLRYYSDPQEGAVERRYTFQPAKSGG